MDIMFKVFGALGLLGIIIGVLIKNEKKQDLVFIIGGLLLLTYSSYIKDPIFIVLQVVFIIVALIELIQLSRHRSVWKRFKHKIK